ncbi:MAG: hypothetical protein M1817_000414 [Caeruleum heppii]|nr:MAG: hypothetical protein M1817_000414 [Caeruleum heppii]
MATSNMPMADGSLAMPSQHDPTKITPLTFETLSKVEDLYDFRKYGRANEESAGGWSTSSNFEEELSGLYKVPTIRPITWMSPSVYSGSSGSDITDDGDTTSEDGGSGIFSTVASNITEAGSIVTVVAVESNEEETLSVPAKKLSAQQIAIEEKVPSHVSEKDEVPSQSIDQAAVQDGTSSNSTTEKSGHEKAEKADVVNQVKTNFSVTAGIGTQPLKGIGSSNNSTSTASSQTSGGVGDRLLTPDDSSTSSTQMDPIPVEASSISRAGPDQLLEDLFGLSNTGSTAAVARPKSYVIRLPPGPAGSPQAKVTAGVHRAGKYSSNKTTKSSGSKLVLTSGDTTGHVVKTSTDTENNVKDEKSFYREKTLPAKVIGGKIVLAADVEKEWPALGSVPTKTNVSFLRSSEKPSGITQGQPTAGSKDAQPSASHFDDDDDPDSRLRPFGPGIYEPPRRSPEEIHAEWVAYLEGMKKKELQAKRCRDLKRQNAWRLRKELVHQGKCQFYLPREVMIEILLHLNGASRKNLALSCTDAANLVLPLTTTWDISTGQFFGAEKGGKRKGRGDAEQMMTSHAITVVTENPDYLTLEPKRKGKGYMARELSMLKKMTLACHNVGDQIRHLELHSIPLLTISLLRLLVPEMTSLAYLGVLKCDLIDLGHVPYILEIACMGDRQHPLRLDLYPSMVVREWKQINLRVAIPAVLYYILPQALEQGAGLVDRGAAFLRWLGESSSGVSTELLRRIQRCRQDEWVVRDISAKNQLLASKQLCTGDDQFFRCRKKHPKLRGCFFSVLPVRGELRRPLCWGCTLLKELQYAREHPNGPLDHYLHVNTWLEDVETLDLAMDIARKDRPIPLHRDQTFQQMRVAREERILREKLIREGKIRPGQKRIPGRYQFSRIPACRA